MTQDQAAKLVAKWQERFGLTEWHVKVIGVDAPTLPRERLGVATFCEEALEAVFELALKRPAKQVEYTVVHEWTHILLTPTRNVMLEVLKSLGPAEKAVYDRLLHDQEEQVCNRLGRHLSGMREVLIKPSDAGDDGE